MNEERPSIHKVLEKVKELPHSVEPQNIGNGPHNCQVVVSKYRVIYSDTENNLNEFNLNMGKNSMLKVKTEGVSITAVHVSQDGSRCYVAQSNNKLYVIYLFNDRKVEEKDYGDEDLISDITSHGEAVYLILMDGAVLRYDRDINKEFRSELKKAHEKNLMISSSLKVSPSGKYLVFDQIEDIRKICIYNIKDNQKSEPFSFQCYPWNFDKLLVFSKKSQNLFTISASQKSIINISLISGQIIQFTAEQSSKISQILVSQEDETVYSCSNEQKILVWDWINQTIKGKLVSHGCQIDSLVLSKNENLLFAGSCQNKLTIWNTKFLFKLAEIDFKKPLTHLSLSQFDNNLVAVSWMKEKIEISSLLLQEYHLQIQDELSPFCYITPDEEHLAIPIASEQCIRIWNLNQMKVVGQFVFQDVEPSKYLLNGTHDSKYIFVQVSKREIVIWNCGKESEHDRRRSIQNIYQIVIDTDKLNIQSENKTCGILVFTIDEHLNNDERKVQIPRCKGEPIYTAFTQRVIYYCYSDKESQIQLRSPQWKQCGYKDQLLVSSEHELFVQPTDGNQEKAYFILISKENKYINIGSFAGRLNNEDIDNAETFIDFDSSIEAAAFDNTGEYFIVKSSEKTRIWHTDGWKEVFSTKDQLDIVRTYNGAFQGFIHKGCYKPWKRTLALWSSFDDYTQDTEQNEQNEQNERFKNDFQINNTGISGPYNILASLLLSSMLDSKRKDQAKYIHLLGDNAIYPYKLNLGHIFAYTNNAICLQKYLKQNYLYRQDSFWNFPLHYAFDRNSAQCCSAILEYIIREDEDFYSELNHDHLVKLIELSPPKLKEFFDNAMKINEEKEIPSHAELVPCYFPDWIGGNQFGTDIRYLLTGDVDVKTEDLHSLVKIDYHKKNVKSIEMCSLKFKYDFTPGSSQSIQLLQSLSYHEEKASFRSLTLQHILWYKWVQVRTFAYLEAIIKLLCYVLLFALLVCFGDKAMQEKSELDVTSVISERDVLMVIACFLQAYDLIFLVTRTVHPCRLERNIWTWLSMIQHPLLIVAVNVDFSENQKLFQSLLGCINILYWAQCILQFRLLKTTRVLIYMIRQVLKKMVPFMVVLSMVIGGFSLTYHILRKEYLDSYLSALENTYTLIFGDFNTDDYERAGWIVFCLASFLATLVLMNLLIAIMSDAYAEVMSEKIPSDYQELTEIILDIERKFFCWNRGEKKKSHLHFAKYATTFDGEAWEGAYGAIRQQSESKEPISKMQNQIVKMISSLRDELSKKITESQQTHSCQRNKTDAAEKVNLESSLNQKLLDELEKSNYPPQDQLEQQRQEMEEEKQQEKEEEKKKKKEQENEEQNIERSAFDI